MKIMINMLLLFLHWAPRILLILSAALLAIFNWILLLIGILVLVLSWKWPWIGGLISITLGIAYIIYGWGDLDHFIYVSLLVIGVLFLLGWFFRKEIIKAQDAYWENTQIRESRHNLSSVPKEQLNLKTHFMNPFYLCFCN